MNRGKFLKNFGLAVAGAGTATIIQNYYKEIPLVKDIFKSSCKIFPLPKEIKVDSFINNTLGNVYNEFIHFNFHYHSTKFNLKANMRDNVFNEDGNLLPSESAIYKTALMKTLEHLTSVYKNQIDKGNFELDEQKRHVKVDFSEQNPYKFHVKGKEYHTGLIVTRIDAENRFYKVEDPFFVTMGFFQSRIIRKHTEDLYKYALEAK